MKVDCKNAAYWIAAQAGVTPLAIGMPGVAKTASISAFARATMRSCYTLIGSLRDPADIGGYPYAAPSQHNGHHVMQLVPPKWADDTLDGRIWIISFDELTTCPPAVQAAMLRVISERVVGDLPLGPNTWTMAACNPPDMAANGTDLEPPMANRLYHHKWVMDWESWDQGMMSGGVFPAPKFPLLPDNWETKLPEIGALVAAFRIRMPGEFEGYPKERSKASGPWASPRSWTNAVRCLAAAEAVGVSQETQHELVEGCVGYSGANTLFEYRRMLDLPPPEELIEAAIKALANGDVMDYTHPNRGDKVIAMLGSVTSAVLANKTKDRWEGGMRVYEEAAKNAPDVALSCVRPLAQAYEKGAGWHMSAEFVARMNPLFAKVMM
jgi:hypothetical protein